MLQINLMQLLKGLEMTVVFISKADGVHRQENIVMQWHIVARVIEASICFLTRKKKKHRPSQII